MAEENKDETFTIKDRRRFVVDAAGDAHSEPEPASPPTGERQNQESPRAKAAPHEHMPLPEIDFPAFILSLSSSALLHLGLIENPVSRKSERNLPLAKQTIDIIAMLRDKTKGNLSPEESGLVDDLITDLRLKYVNEIRK